MPGVVSREASLRDELSPAAVRPVADYNTLRIGNGDYDVARVGSIFRVELGGQLQVFRPGLPEQLLSSLVDAHKVRDMSRANG